ncbi:glutathione S-transferase N-terminal domain-containing protein, partial [Pelomicrobium sp. G1]|uniref:glutathione S-transferase N-terminal domain-containing protein n=1 Tax=Pelomicrobium sp. G1 TaxID=3452920 RepID=UPI003F759A21
MQLYTYHRSSAAYRVRIALHLKGIEYQPRFVHLVRGEQHHPEHRALNPHWFVPVLVDGERVLTQS